MTRQTERESAIVVALRDPREQDAAFTYRMDELCGLCNAAGARVVGTLSQERPIPDAALYVGSGKVTEVAEALSELGAHLAVFDGELSPAQVRNLENRLNCRVIDRTQLILDIFAQRAQSRAGRLQVEIAQLQYLLPRLTGRGAAMSRLGAGIGTRGPGETKLEIDRRRIRARISRLKQSLKALDRTRQTQRAKRQASVPVVALVGYTNAGKTTLLHRWTDERGTGRAVEGQNRLFDTLDPTARRVRGGTIGTLVLMDTVGFVQNLPHQLIEAFRATLEEVRLADVIVQVVDASVEVDTHVATTHNVLREIGAVDKPLITFFNKMDRATVEPPPDTQAMQSLYGSAATGAGLDELYRAVERIVSLDPVEVTIVGPADSADFWQSIAKSAKILHADALADGMVRLTLQVDRRHVAALQTGAEG